MAELKNARLLMRQDTADKWSENNPVLKAGELGFEVVEGKPAETKIKIGDGTTPWNELGYMYDTSAILDMIPQGESVYTVADLSEIVDPVNGDMAIVTATVAEDKVSRTAYIYDGKVSDWCALDGNYNASNVYFDSDFTITAPIGTVTQAQIDAGNGSVDKAAAGVNMQTFFAGLFAEIKDPTITQPNLTVSLAKTSISQEVGTTYTVPKATATLSPGSYSYGTVSAPGVTGTGIVATKIKLTDNKTDGSNEVTGTNTCAYTASVADTLVTDSAQSLTYTATCEYPASELQPINNIKGTTNKDGVTYSKIATGTDSATATCTISGYRKMFMGPIAKDATLNSATIRGIASTYINKQESKTAQEFTAPVGTERMIVAFRKDYTTATPTFEYFTMSYESFAGFKRVNDENGAAKTVLVSDARGGENGQVEYIVYECTSNALEAATKFKIKLN